MKPIEITETNFKTEVEESPLPVLVDFWASWCGPCRMLAPVIEALAEERGSSVKFGKVNVDEQPALAARFSINAIPAVLLFKDGRVAGSSIGYCPKEQLEALLK